MKRILMTSLVLCGLLLFTGCGEKKLNSYEKTMQEYATNYYNSALKGTEGMTSTKITVKQLRNAPTAYFNYDMTKLESCTEDSYVELSINTTDNSIASINYHMECGK